MLVAKLILFLFVSIVDSLPSNSYYLIDIDKRQPSNESYCSNIVTNEQTYRLPNECHQHLLCDPYYCDDKSFRCVKIRETLCCLHRHFQAHCRGDHANRIRDLFRSVYFQMSIEHGYCEINLERIEKADQAYCIADVVEVARSTQTTTTTMAVRPASTRTTYKHFHRRPSPSRSNRQRYRVAARQNYSSLANLNYLRQVTIVEETVSSTSPRILIDLCSTIIFLLSVLV